MHPALWVSKTGTDAQETNIQMISNNLANVSTIGFKKGRAVFEDLLYQTVRQPGGQSSQDTTLPSGFMRGTGVRVASTQKLFKQGGMVQTDNPLDLAIVGDGFFRILQPTGETAYTRDGQFQVDSAGQMITSSGYQLQPSITIPSDATSVTIGSDGTVSVTNAGSTTSTTVGTIQTAMFLNPAGLQPLGGNLYTETSASGAPTTNTPGESGAGALSQGSLETSNVSVVEELVGLIEAQRAYEMNAKSISTVDGMLQYISQTL